MTPFRRTNRMIAAGFVLFAAFCVVAFFDAVMKGM